MTYHEPLRRTSVFDLFGIGNYVAKGTLLQLRRRKNDHHGESSRQPKEGTARGSSSLACAVRSAQAQYAHQQVAYRQTPRASIGSDNSIRQGKPISCNR